ncbi:ATP-binding protein [Sansalvadorimonas verongulae]|uniref:ATP-binding protein n=1 Tax=Sansalvadorimonas verongulae TaxID=2172824 RepID=UPI0012BD2936|nr:ATP-binding protein [Sansalvadorimonas verongulae]MTI15329.1 ATP-binding protein [Sansalvadorimonas verongulae]
MTLSPSSEPLYPKSTGYCPRAIESNLKACIADTPAIIITGPRQSGKTTLVKELLKKCGGGSYHTLDDENILALAEADPVGFLRQQQSQQTHPEAPAPIIIDEIQRAPSLIRTIKLLIDERRRPGAFILTGSADLMTLPTLADSLAGRAEFITLYPFSHPERAYQGQSSTPPDIISQLLAPDYSPQAGAPLSLRQLQDIILQGGYPEAVTRSGTRRSRWHKSYADAVIRRDIKELFQLQKLDEMGQLFKALAAISSEALSYAALGRAAQMDTKSVQKYVAALENLYLIKRIPGWHRNELKRTVKQPKVHFIDTGLLCTTRGITTTHLHKNPNLMGPLMETWVGSELLKAMAVSEQESNLFYYRDQNRREVDFILEGQDGQATGIEVKAGMTIKKSMFSTLEMLLEAGVIQRGVVVYNGDQILPFSDRLLAVPAGSLLSGC